MLDNCISLLQFLCCIRGRGGRRRGRGGEVAAARQLGEETVVEGGLLIEVEDFGEEGAYKPAVTLEYRGAL